MEALLKTELNKVLNGNRDRIRENCITSSIPKKIAILFNPDSKENTKNLVFIHPSKDNPNFFFINEFLLLFDWQNSSELIELEKNFQINLTSRITQETINTGYITEEEHIKIRDFCNGILASEFLIKVSETFKKEYRNKYGKEASQATIGKLFNELIYADLNDTVKYSNDRIQQLIEKYLLP
jgi:hypothetical protein